ncbi:hypothetical protein [Endozoicomonas sp. 8E]|uniref:hypothetical protein n=1 Tax=Endozoicomonas sp. 8E TaxID=3035692 RepID=UPI002938E559|nr:hypothetical protein [Endozoicomonas sp. 8E]WOG26847.1 hypothetical protein P6910_20205 [Endozoicomonas sp. 8E]
MTTSEHGNKLLEFCDTRLRGNDDLRAWERVVGVLRQPLREEAGKRPTKILQSVIQTGIGSGFFIEQFRLQTLKAMEFNMTNLS